MPDKETEIIIRERIKKLDEVVAQLKKLRQLSKRKFFAGKTVQYAAMYAMVIGIEAICDMGNHILAKYFNRAAETYKDVILLLGEEGVIPKNFAQKSSKMTDFRNVLIHVYLEVDEKKVFENLQKAPEEFTKFSRYFLQFLEKR